MDRLSDFLGYRIDKTSTSLTQVLQRGALCDFLGSREDSTSRALTHLAEGPSACRLSGLA